MHGQINDLYCSVLSMSETIYCKWGRPGPGRGLLSVYIMCPSSLASQSPVSGQTWRNVWEGHRVETFNIKHLTFLSEIVDKSESKFPIKSYVPPKTKSNLGTKNFYLTNWIANSKNCILQTCLLRKTCQCRFREYFDFILFVLILDLSFVFLLFPYKVLVFVFEGLNVVGRLVPSIWG